MQVRMESWFYFREPDDNKDKDIYDKSVKSPHY